ncbi:MAG: SMI1/KNR4 family protein [Gemmataceae bacterium]
MPPDAIARLRALAELIPRPGCEWESRPIIAPPAGATVVAELAVAAGFDLPADFLDFLADTAAVIGMSVHNGYHIGDPDVLTATLRAGDLPSNVHGTRSIPVGFDGGGNAFLITAAGEVWKWDHETGAVSPVASSFGAFLDRVALDWSAYLADTPGWRFLV